MKSHKVKVRKATKRETVWCRQHKIKDNPGEINKDYSSYECAVALIQGEIVAYVFYVMVFNQGEIHAIWSKLGLDAALGECVVFAYKDLVALGAKEVGTFIATDDKHELDFFKSLGFQPDYYWALIKTEHWWKAEAGLEKNVYEDIKKQIGRL